MASTAIVVKQETFPGLYFDPQELHEIMEANAGASGFSILDLDRIKIPAGGGTTWEVPTLDGNDARKELFGVIVAKKEEKNYWELGLDEKSENSPPDCHSDDMVNGIGMPGGVCATCAFNQFGSAKKGKGKACRDENMLFLLLEGRTLPVVVKAAPSSLEPVRKYMLRLTSQSHAYYGVMTKLTLEKEGGSGGPPVHSVIIPQFVQALSADEKARAKALGEAVMAALKSRR